MCVGIFFKKCFLFQANTFQAVLVTDGVLTFVIYNYNKIQFALYEKYMYNAQVGFNKGKSTNYYAVEGSGTEGIATVVSRTNVNRTGKFVFRLNGYMARPVKVADIVFVIDSSYSEAKFFDNILQYIVDVTDNLIIAPNETQVAVISFSRIARVEFDFTVCQNNDCVHERVLNISQLNSTSYMDTGLDLASDMFLWTKGGRQSALKYVVMISDGLVNNRDKAKRKARELSQRQDGIKVVGVGLGRSVYHTVLESVAFNSSYLLAPDPHKLLHLLQWDLHDPNVTGCVHNFSADILVIVETSASQSDKSFKKALTFLQTFMDKFNPSHTDNAITISVAVYSSTTNYVIRECPLSSLQYIMDAIRTLGQSKDQEQNWDHMLRFVDNHTSYSSVTTHKYAMFVTTGSVPEKSVVHVKTKLMHLRDNNSVRVVMVGITDHSNWKVLENVYDCGFYTFSTEDVDIVSRVLLNDIKSTNCTKLGK
ncbi:collagen alpha-3(VI) chain-like [Pecten maximus]|uniref:collagen alpha-3(VI) chain-like n=1 Tax=Pecten maximus TaxID=6579 RepID=UPI001458C271|nr:collagen alpha-3(VI) chain-like [Pecten maximus]